MDVLECVACCVLSDELYSQHGISPYFHRRGECCIFGFPKYTCSGAVATAPTTCETTDY